MPTSLLWFRRDLRLSDHPALLAAVESAGADGAVVPVFVLDPRLWTPAGAPRRQFLLDCLAALQESLDGALVLRSGDPATVVPDLVREVQAGSVHVSADAGPYGRSRDAAVERALGDVPLVRTGSPYAVTPGRVTKADGSPFRVFTPFARAWRAHGWRAPAPRPDRVPWLTDVRSDAPPPGRGDRRSAAGGRRGAALDGLGTLPRRAPARLRREPQRPGHRRDEPALALPQVRLPAPAHAARRPRPSGPRGIRSRRYTDELAWRDFYADVLGTGRRPRTRRSTPGWPR